MEEIKDLIKAIQIVNKFAYDKVDELLLDRKLFKKYFGKGYLKKVEYTTCDLWNFGYISYKYSYKDLESGIEFSSYEFSDSIKKLGKTTEETVEKITEKITEKIMEN